MSAVERHVFVSYCRADATWLARLKVHLRPLVRRAALDLWDDSRISPGQTWHDEIAKALARAHVAVLLVSADFLASDFVANNELPPLLRRAATGGLLIVPLIVSPCLFLEDEELSRYQCVNTPDRPLSSMSQAEAEATLLSLSRSLDQYLRLLDTATPRPRVPPTPAAPRVQAPSAYPAPFQADRSRSIAAINQPEPSRNDPLAVDRPINMSFDGAAPGGIPVGWFNSFGYVSGVSTDYAIRVTRRSQEPTDGTCVVLENTAATANHFGSLMQRCAGRFLAGRTIRLEGELRVQNVPGWAGLWLRADAEAHPSLFFDNMARRPVTGTTGWARYFIDAPIPNDTDWINYGIVLSGPGALYADNLRLLVWTPEGRWEDV